MKRRIQWIAALFTAASAGLAMGYSCSSETLLLTPVRERIIVEQPSSLNWGTPFHALGSVVSAPFVALGNAFSGPSVRYVEPVGERLTTYQRTWVTQRSSTMLMPVGERFTTVKIIRSKPLLQPVGERFIIVKHHKTMLKPVGERFLKGKHHKMLLKPVGERFTTVTRYQKVLLEPVGEKITTIKYIKMAPVLEPVGERTIIRTTRVYSQPWLCY